MRYVCRTAVAVLSFLVVSEARAQDVPGLSITNYQFVTEQRWSRTQSYMTYRADLVNTGPARDAVSATVKSLVPSIEVIPGESNLHFPPVPAGGRVTSINTFTVLVDRSLPFDPASLRWSFLVPLANAGGNQTVRIGETVTLNGSKSTNPSGVGTLSYKWSFASRPYGTAARLIGTESVIATFVADVPGQYVVLLTVTNGIGTDTSTAVISTVNSPPVANAGPSQTASLGNVVYLNGAGSSDVDGDPLTYSWSFISRPSGSLATLSVPTAVSPSFIADKAGTYILKLVVNDGKADSQPSTVQITTKNTPPVASAGPNQAVKVGAVVQLSGAASTDVDGDALTYHWQFNSVPAGSTAALSNPVAVNPAFTADKAGTYVVQLLVNDGKADSDPATVTITTDTIQPPTASAGPNQTVKHGDTVLLTGTATDPQGLPLSFHWSMTSRPPESTATLSSATNPRPTFTADVPGQYVVQLIVNNGYLNSSPSTATITTTNTPPVAVAGSGQTVQVGATVNLNGSASSDSDGDPLSYVWSLITRPGGSAAVLSGAGTATPSFVADIGGTYVAQLIVSDKFVNSDPATVTITAGVKAITLSPTPLNVSQHSVATLTVSLGSPAGPGGVDIRLASSDPGVISVPQTVNVPQGQTSMTVQVTSGSTGTALILATATGFAPGSVTANVTVPGIALAVDASTIGITATTKATITLSDPVSSGGVVVSVSALPAGVVTVPATVNIASGTTGTFTVAAAGIGTTTITARIPGYNAGSASISVTNLGAIRLESNATVGPGKSVPFGVSLLTPAPVGGVTVNLTSSAPTIATITSSVFIPQGATTPAEPAQLTGVNFGSANIIASAPGFQNDTQSVRVAATLSFSPNTLTVGAGGTGNLTLTLSAPAPAGLIVNLSSDKPAVASVPASVPFPAGATSVSVVVTGASAGSTTIHASALPHLADTTATVSVATLGKIELPANASVGLGSAASYPISLSVPAPAGGTVVTLTSSDPSKLGFSSATVTIPTGSTTPTAQPQIVGKAPGSVNITATAPAYGSATASATVTAALSFSPQTISVQVSGTQNIMVTLPSAVAAPVVVALASDNTSVVTVPSSVTIPANGVGASVTITGVAVGSTKIRATASGLTAAEATVNVQTGGTIGLPANVTVPLGGTTPFAVSLPQPAAAKTTITLATSDAARISVSPSTVVVEAGQTTPASQPNLRGVSVGSATISASASGYTSGNQSVNVTASLSFTPSNLTISGFAKQNATLKLSAVTPVPLLINLSSAKTDVATVPASVTIPANSDTASVQVTAVGIGSAVIRASYAPYIPEATASVTVQSAGKIQLPASTSVALTKSAPFAVTLPGPAPADVTISLSSSDASKVSISPATVTVAAGATSPATQPQVTGVSIGTADITVSAPGYTSATAPVNVTASLSFSSPSISVSKGGSQSVTLTLSASTPAAVTVSLSSDDTAVATVPASAVIPANANSVSISVKGVAAGTTTIRANGPAGVAATSASVTVGSDIILSPSVTVAPGAQANLSVSIGEPAPSAVYIQLTSSDTSKVTLQQATVVIQAGQTQPAAMPRVNGIAFGTATISASATGLTSATTTVTVGAALSFGSSSITLAPSASDTVGINLSAPAPDSGLVVNLQSSNTGVATVPASVTIPANQSGILVRVSAVAVGTATLTATSPVPTVSSATMSVTVAAPGSIVLPASATVGMGESIAYPISLSSPAGSSGVTVTLDASSANVSFVPLQCSGTPCPPVPSNATHTTVFIASGQTTPAAQPQIRGVSPGAVAIAASAPGFATVTKPVQVTASFAFNPQTLTIAPGTKGNLLLVLSGAAPPPPTGLTVTLTSSNPAVATVAASVTAFWDGSSPTSLNIPVSGVAGGTATIRASSPNMVDATATITVSAPVSITTTSLPGGIVNQAYTATLAAGGGKTPYTWSATNLPPALTIDTSTGVISGVPTAAGTRTITVTVRDATTPTPNSTTKNLAVTIASALSITTTSLPGGVVGGSYNATLAAANGTAPYAWAATGLPAGLMLNASTGVISGTPTAPGTSSVAITVTDSTSPVKQTASTTVNLTIGQGLGITTAALPSGVVNAAYTTTLAAAGGTKPYTWSAGGLPAGLTLNTSTGVISGTPTTAGTSTVAVTVTDATSPAHLTASGNLQLIITAAMTIATAALPNGVAGSAYSVTLAATGGMAPYTWSATGLPSGLTLNATTGVISGTPTVAGTSTVAVAVQDSASPTRSTATKSLPLSIAPALAITTVSLPSGVVGAGYSSSIAASGGNPPYTWAASGLPSGLTLNTSTGAISGTPTGPGTSNVTFTVTDSTAPHATATRSLSVVIVPALSIATASLPGGVVAMAYSTTLTASGGSSPYTWSAAGLPPGLTINSSGVITGIPTTAGTSTVSITVMDSTAPAHLTATKSLTLIIAPSLSLTTTWLPNGSVNAAYSVTLAATGGTPPYSWAATGLPAGLSLNTSTGVISGTPTTQATATVAVAVSDSTVPTKITASRNLSLTIGKAIPASIVATAGSGQSAVIGTQFATALQVSVRDANNAPIAGQLVSFTAPPAGASLTFGGGGNSVGIVTNSNGLATSSAITANAIAGSYTVTASVPGLAPATFSLTNTTGGPTSALSVTNVSVGRNLQTPILVSLPEPAGTGGVVVTVSSGDPTRILLGGTAKNSVQVTIPEGATQANILVQAVDGTGSAIVTASAPGYLNGTGTVTITPSGIVIAGPNDIGASFLTFVGDLTTLTVFSARLDSTGKYVEKQMLRSSLPALVNIDVSSTSAGTVSPLSVTINPGNGSAPLTFTAVNTGTATVTAATPAGFTAPTDGSNTVNATVQPGGLTMPGAFTVGRNLQVRTSIDLKGVAPAGGTAMTITSDDPTRLRFSLSPNTAGTPSLTINLPENARGTPEFYVQAVGAGGTTMRAQATGFGSGTTAVTIGPSGIVFTNAFGGVPNPVLASTAGSPVTVTIYSALLDGSGNWMETQAVAGGMSTTVNVTNSGTAAVGLVTPSQVTIPGGGVSGSTQFQPGSAGTTNLSVSVPVTPTGFSTPSALYSTLPVTVTTPRIILTATEMPIGKNLQIQGAVVLNQAAPAGGVVVTVTSNSAQLLLSKTATAAGANSIQLTVPAGSTNATYYVQSLGSSGTATYKATATGFLDGTASVDLTPSGVVVSATAELPFLTIPAGTDTAEIFVYMAQLNAADSTYNSAQTLRGGLSLSVVLSPENNGIVTVKSPVTIGGGVDPTTITTTLTRAGTGTTNVKVTQPSGYTAATNPIFVLKPMPLIQVRVD